VCIGGKKAMQTIAARPAAFDLDDVEITELG
jgi:hypothetical protein